jgi:hypothetical protein
MWILHLKYKSKSSKDSQSKNKKENTPKEEHLLKRNSNAKFKVAKANFPRK